VSLYLVQDTRDFVGNCMVFWALKGNGYTTDLSAAQTYTYAEAQAMHRSRYTDLPWPLAYLRDKARPRVDHQHAKWAEANLADPIERHVPLRAKPDSVMNCCGCGSFISATGRYASNCKKCGADNRP
jgi:hypothetical protein